MKILLILLLSLALAPKVVKATDFDSKNPLLVQAHLEPFEWQVGQNGLLILNLQLPENFHAYADQFKIQILEPDGFKQGQMEISPLKEWFDKFSKRNRKGIGSQATMKIRLEAPTQFQSLAEKFKFDLTYQACTETFCLFPVTKSIEIPIRLKAHAVLTTSEPPPPARSFWKNFSSLENFKLGLSESWALALFLAFIAGILTSFTPCIFPMIPITLAVLGHHSEKRTRLQNFTLSLVYVHGIALTYSLLGLFAASSGNLFGASLGSPWVLGGICFILLVMSLSMYGMFEFQMPSFIRQKFGMGSKQGGYLGAFLSGLFAGIVASPCVGPILVAILAFVASQKNLFFGFFLLFTYAMGMGLIFLFLGVFSEFTRRLPKSGPWMEAVKFTLGSLMLAAFYYYLDLLVPQRWWDSSLGIGLIVLASLSGAFITSPHTNWQRLRKGALGALLFIGMAYLSIGILDLRPLLNPPHSETLETKNSSWQAYQKETFLAALRSGKPVILDFYADWCVACHELEKHTFSNNDVIKATAGMHLFRFDATEDSPELEELKTKYNIQGLPTVVFHDSNGRWLEHLNLTQFENAESFLNRLKKVLPQK